MREVKNILVINESLSHNIGDRAIAGGLTAAINAVSGGQAKVHKFWLQKGIAVDDAALAVPAAGAGKSDSMSMQASYLYHTAWTGRYLLRLLRALGRIKQMDLAVFGGGSLIMDNRLQFPTAMYLLGLVLNRYKIPYAVSGVSLSGEISGPAAWLFRRFLAGACHVDMRDPISREKAQAQFGVHVAPGSDYAFCLPALPAPSPAPEYDLLLNVTSAVSERAAYRDFLQRMLSAFQDKKILLATTGDVGDELLTAELYAEYQRDGLQVCYAKSYAEYCSAVARARQVVASRLHSGILAVAMATPTSIVNVGYKQKGFFKGIGLERCVVDYTAPVSALSEAWVPISANERAAIAETQQAICLKNIGKLVGRV
ncbi:MULTISPECIES: polysaccharide pyruvyl transferase family protein [unclassified Duganella]|uniref:polysaccharide pyruvyl transferase family protein n=1 Tax=unclassified Duganella TaxID=2636909 RepID=UPI000885737D|nr:MULTISPECIES: polysaccharide pyruvyl transferase family protein [unclassified Duganella]SDH36319.1 Polysaccharide pyruvyl transferase family protein WcaK [Duganella sp. OV458]SDK52678.1 Polysaccharide pyruvyl transferase family protein WcaK [Duganella sp. OV510]